MSTISCCQIPLEKRESPYGKGGFAVEFLPKGAIVIPQWTESFYENMDGWVYLSRKEILGLPEENKNLFFKYGLDVDFDRLVGPLHNDFVNTVDNFINHSCSPNLQFDCYGNVVAAEDIRKGAEVFIDYGCFTVNFDENFQCHCNSANCRGRVSRNDWMGLVKLYGFNMPRFLHHRIGRNING